MSKLIIICIAIFSISNASADRSFTFKYNFYHKTGTANHKFVGEHDSRMPPSALNRYLSNPNVYAVPTNASSQYAPWHRSLSIKAPSNSGGRGGPDPKKKVVE